MKKTFVLIFLIFLLAFTVNAQTDSLQTETVYRINFLNPGFEIELPTANFSTFSAELGVGYGGSYPDLSGNGNGFRILIAPFLDLQQKWFYNFQKRQAKNLETKHNSGNFISARLLTRGSKIYGNFDRTSDFDFAFGPTWGVQRHYGSFHLLFDAGFIYYFDTKGNSNFFPLMLQLNLGFDL